MRGALHASRACRRAGVSKEGGSAGKTCGRAGMRACGRGEVLVALPRGCSHKMLREGTEKGMIERTRVKIAGKHAVPAVVERRDIRLINAWGLWPGLATTK